MDTRPGGYEGKQKGKGNPKHQKGIKMDELILFLLAIAWIVSEVVSMELHRKDEKEENKND